MRSYRITKRFKLIACGVLKKEFRVVRDSLPGDISLEETFFEQGLHRDPERLNMMIKDEIRRTEESGEHFDAVLLGYGVCSRGTIGVKSDRFRIVIPRAHDCITLFLGSKERYLEEFSSSPGTYWFTPGFVSGSLQPGMSEKYSGVYQQFEKHYEEYLHRFGDKDLAHYIIDQQEQAWIKNYTRGAYVESGLSGGDALRKKARAFCEARGWCFEEINSDLSLLGDLIAGRWDDNRFLVLDPGDVIELGTASGIITGRGGKQSETPESDNYHRSFFFHNGYHETPLDIQDHHHNGLDLVIGIDAGGTYTDAAVVSLLDHTVRASAKSPTTHHDLSKGIRDALRKLPADLRIKASRLAISTTLATNAIVEEKGGRTGLILLGYGEDTMSLVNVGSGDIKTNVSGCHDIYGSELAPLDEYGLISAALSMVERGAEALAISSYMGTRNPEHEIRARFLLKDRFSVPVVTGHELTDDIDSVRRAHTVLLNARLLPVIGRLIRSVEQVVEEEKLPGDVRFITTDGTLMNAAEAREQPVRLVLSGPAASVKGVRFLCDIDSCVLVDMGGTTSDIAVIEGGAAKRTGRGASVGVYKTSIKATDLRTIGLGGDSCIRWGNGNVQVGPERVFPLSVAASKYEEIREALESLRGYNASDYSLVQPGTHYLMVRRPENGSFLTEREREILAHLENGPLSIVALAERLVYPYLSLLGTNRLEELGYIRKCGLTPTDIMVADGSIDSWDKTTADIIIDLYAQRAGISPGQFMDLVWREIHRSASSSVITEVLEGGESDKKFPGCRLCESAFEGTSAIDVTFRLRHPLVGIGAPSHLMLDGVNRFLMCEKIFPENAGVANAVGAAAGTGGMHLDMNIMLDGEGRYILYAPDGMVVFRDLGEAKVEAIRLSKEYALTHAERMKYNTFSLDLHIRDRCAPTSFESELYIETSIVATMRY